MIRYLTILLLLIFHFSGYSQIIYDDFEGGGNITSWFGDDCPININFDNPHKQGINTSLKVLQYRDEGGQYANVRFQKDQKLNLSSNAVFTLKVYLVSNSMTGNPRNQISLKLQDGSIDQPWITQSEIIKPLLLNQWQAITFDFSKDNYINLDPQSLPPTKRKDFNRIVIQINGENNNDSVIAYLDDVSHNGKFVKEAVYDKLIWADEFDKNGTIDPSKWFHQTRIPIGDSWFNGEVQHYTNRLANSFVENGLLNIVARKESFSSQGVTKQYTSARLNSKFAFKYGKVVMRAKLPTGRGTWPAFWTLGKNINENGSYWQSQGFGTTSWPECGEIDIMEHWGNNQNVVVSATHTPSSFGNTINVGSQFIPNASSGFNLYELEWTPDELIFSVNGVTHFVYCPDIKDNRTWPFDAEQFFLLNIAIQPTISASFTQSAMQIDYIRVYQESETSQVVNENVFKHHYFPNPVTDVLHIEMKQANLPSAAIKIFNISGQLMVSRTVPVMDHKLIIDQWAKFPEGIYIVQYEVDNKVENIRVIK